jgi:hypothetical protein
MPTKYPFQIRVTHKVGDKLLMRTHHYETLIAAATSSQVFLRKVGVRRIEILMVLEDIALSNHSDIEQLFAADR